MTEAQKKPKIAYKRAPVPASSVAYMGSILPMLATGEDTLGRFAVVEYRAKPGNEPPPHYHEWEDEFFYLIEGEIEFYCEDQKFNARTGEVAFLPQGKPHAFHILTPFVRALIMVHAVDERPVRIDRYFAEMGEPAATMQLPSGAVTHAMADPARAIQIAAENGIVIMSAEDTRQALPNYPGFGIPRLPTPAFNHL